MYPSDEFFAAKSEHKRFVNLGVARGARGTLDPSKIPQSGCGFPGCSFPILHLETCILHRFEASCIAF